MALDDYGKIKVGSTFIVDASKHFNSNIQTNTNWSNGIGFKDNLGTERLLYSSGLDIGTTLTTSRPLTSRLGWGNITGSIPYVSVDSLPIYINVSGSLRQFSVIDPSTVITPKPQYILLSGSASASSVITSLGNKVYGPHQSLVIALQGGGGGGGGGGNLLATRDAGGGGAGSFTMVLLPIYHLYSNGNFIAGAGGAGGQGVADANGSPGSYGNYSSFRINDYYYGGTILIQAYGGSYGMSPGSETASVPASAWNLQGYSDPNLKYFELPAINDIKSLFVIDSLPGTKGGDIGGTATNIDINKSTRNTSIYLFPNPITYKGYNRINSLYKLHFESITDYIEITERVSGMGHPGGSSWWSLGGQGAQNTNAAALPGENGSGGGGGNSSGTNDNRRDGGAGGNGFVVIMF